MSSTMELLTVIMIFLFSSAAFAADTLPSDLGNKVFLRMKADKSKAYISERILLTVTLYAEGLLVRDIQRPKLVHDGFEAEEMLDTAQGTAIVSGVTYHTTQFQTYLAAMEPGRLQIGPATLECNAILPASDNPVDAFFGSRVEHALHLSAQAIPLTIQALPTAGRPADYQGAIGRYDLSLTAQPLAVMTGDPVTVKMEVTGTGNFATVRCPAIESDSRFRTYPLRIAATPAGVICEQVVLPLVESVTSLPPVQFSFFDPEKGGYFSITSKAVDLQVTKMASSAPLTMREGQTPGQRSWQLWAVLLGLLGVTLLLMPKQNRERLSGLWQQQVERLRFARLLRRNLAMAQQAIDGGEGMEFYTISFRTLQEYLGRGLNSFPASITAGILNDPETDTLCGPEVIEKMRMVFKLCDTARFIQTDFDKTEMEKTLAILREVVHLKNIRATSIQGQLIQQQVAAGRSGTHGPYPHHSGCR